MRIVVIGVLLLALLALVAIHWLATRFARYARQLMDQLQAGLPKQAPAPIDPERLPAPVRKFVANAGASADDAARTVYLTQAAELRMGPGKPWTPLRCEQLITIPKPGFVWYAVRTYGPATVIGVVDAYVAEHGQLQARLFGSLPVARASGPEMDRGELLRYLAEIAWAPDAVLQNDALRWRAIDSDTAGLEADSEAGVAGVRLYFSERGDIVEVQADERGSIENGVVVKRPWRGVFSNHQEIGGRRIPTHAEVGYVYNDGYSAYWRGDITGYRLE